LWRRDEAGRNRDRRANRGAERSARSAGAALEEKVRLLLLACDLDLGTHAHRGIGVFAVDDRNLVDPLDPSACVLLPVLRGILDRPVLDLEGRVVVLGLPDE
jgi:hypothetical protein